MKEEKILYFMVIMVIALLSGYIILSIIGRSEEAKRVGELLSLLVIALISYYLGYSKREAEYIVKRVYGMNFAHYRKKYVDRFSLILLGIGIGLAIQHLVCHGVDLELSELLLGHEWIGLLCIIVAYICQGLVKKAYNVMVKEL